MVRVLVTFAVGVLVGVGLMFLSPLARHARSAPHAAGSDPAMAAGVASHTDRTFEFTINGPMNQAAPLFGADKERVWAPGWSPLFLWPANPGDRQGMVFTVAHGEHSAVWVATAYDPDKGFFQYSYIIPRVMTTLITVRLTPQEQLTHAVVRYERTALSPAGNDVVLRMGDEDSKSGPQWEEQINGYLRTLSK